MLLCDRQIAELAEGTPPLLIPFSIESLNPTGYDLRLGPDFKIPVLDAVEQLIDPFNPPPFRDSHRTDYIIIPPHSFVLGASVERVAMPPNVIGIGLGRSTYARAGVLLNTTPLEPGWRGRVTLEISNTNSLPVKVWVGVGIAQVVFFRSEEMPDRDYVAKGGRYQGQEGVTQGKPKQDQE